MVTTITGCKSTFAIEWQIQNELGNYARIRVWAANQYIGTLDEAQIAGIVGHQFNRLINQQGELNGQEVDHENAAFIFEALMNEETGKHLVSMGEAFDDFCILGFVFKSNINLVWRLESEPFFDYPGYAEGVQFASIPIHNVKSVINEFNANFGV